MTHFSWKLQQFLQGLKIQENSSQNTGSPSLNIASALTSALSTAKQMYATIRNYPYRELLSVLQDS